MATRLYSSLDLTALQVVRTFFFSWDTARVVALIRTHIRLGVHPVRWKLARGVIIPKPGKDDYSAAKAYRCISLLNCLGKMVEKVVANLISEHCEATLLRYEDE